MPSLIYMIGLASRNWNCRLPPRDSGRRRVPFASLYQTADIEICRRASLNCAQWWNCLMKLYGQTISRCVIYGDLSYTAGPTRSIRNDKLCFPHFCISSLHPFCSAVLFAGFLDDPPVPREILVNSRGRNHIESFLRVPDVCVWVDTNIFHRWIHTTKERRFLFGETSRRD